jgi:S-adenosylmethionine:tRNA ribosyltransferase-isomerase
MQLSDFSYQLPPERIAQQPVEPRDHSRLLHLDRQTHSIDHHHFYDLPTLLRPTDVLVLNNTRVLPMRLFGHKATGGEVEILLIKKSHTDVASASTPGHEVWEALSRPGLKTGQVVTFDHPAIKTAQPAAAATAGHVFQATCVGKQDYTRLVELNASGAQLLNLLNEYGSIPTPPYITEFVGDPERYQTLFGTRGGSAAAPTAGLHFTHELLATLHQIGIPTIEVTLHVGLGTFLPVKESDITQHIMHSEWYEVSPTAAALINQHKAQGHRIIPVGTTSLRTLESAVDSHGQLQPGQAETKLYCYPPYQFKIADALITNFHLPESTLLMLVAAFCTAPQTSEQFATFQDSWLGQAYTTAIQEEYRFFSFGDAMLIE